MKRFIHRLANLSAFLVGVLFAGAVFAGVIEVRVNDGVPGPWQEATITGEPFIHEFEFELVAESFEVRFSRTPVRVERRLVHQLALSDGGSWVDVPGAEQVGAWRPSHPLRQWEESLADPVVAQRVVRGLQSL